MKLTFNFAAIVVFMVAFWALFIWSVRAVTPAVVRLVESW